MSTQRFCAFLSPIKRQKTLNLANCNCDLLHQADFDVSSRAHWVVCSLPLAMILLLSLWKKVIRTLSFELCLDSFPLANQASNSPLKYKPIGRLLVITLC